MRARTASVLLALLSVGFVGCDHATKAAAQATLSTGRILDLVPGLLELRYAENRDTAFSLLAAHPIPGQRILLALLGVVALSAIVAMWARRREGPVLERAGYALLVAGAVGNVGDRIVRGYVVDFIHLRWWPVFNVADVAAVAGAFLLAWASLRRRRPTSTSG